MLDSVAVDGVFLDLEPEVAARNPLGVAAWFEFGPDGSFEGSGPCNDISGSYDFDGSMLVAVDAVQSAAACSTEGIPVEEFMSLEDIVFEALIGVVVHFSSDIRMQWQGDNAIVTFRRQP
ncbi:MAG: META domain-containing protein [Acidimicrobiia bacterium]|nr:META domain-containing protein [Acidimicrobiia bacterium]